MRIFTAGLLTETNTFAPWPTGLAGFEEGGLFRGDASASGEDNVNTAARLFRDLAQADGHDFIEGLFTIAHPSGPTLQSVYEGFRDEIIGDVQRKGPFDVVLLFLHGAMVAYGYDDCEADLAEQVREAVGPKAIIGVELDPHCHLTQALIDATNCVILMKEYPHVDSAERARELYSICTRAAAGEIKPVSALFDCRMLGFYPTTSEPMAGLVRRFKALEAIPKVLSVSFAHGFPWGDTPATGSKMLAVTDGDSALAAETARSAGLAIYAERDRLLPRMPQIGEALDRAADLPGLVVLADVADNPGGGAPSDNVSFLREILKRGVTDVVLGCIWDPMAVRTCREAGVGAGFMLRLGGKSGEASGDPLDQFVTVRAIMEDHSEAGLGAARANLGPSVWVSIGSVDVVIISERTQTFAPDAFTGMGIDLACKRLVVVKSSQHYQARFREVSEHLINVAGPGAIQMAFQTIPYTKFDASRMFPLHPNPLGQSR